MSSREAKLTIVTGVKGIGKSYLSLKILYAYSKGVPDNNFYPRKVLIFDINNEYQVFSVDNNDAEGLKMFGGQRKIYIDAIDINDILLFSAQKLPEIRRIAPIHLKNVYDKKGKIIARAGDEWTTDEAMLYLLKTIRDFRGGLLLIEDLTSLFGDSIPHNIMSLITRNRHRDLDVIMHLQSIAPILPRFWQNCEWTRFHKQNDGVDKSRLKLQEKYPIYKIVEKMVDKQFFSGNIRFHVNVNNLEMYIIGDFSKEMAMTAIDEYLSENRSEMRDLINKRDAEGIKINDYKQAFASKRQSLFNTYFRKM